MILMRAMLHIFENRHLSELQFSVVWFLLFHRFTSIYLCSVMCYSISTIYCTNDTVWSLTWTLHCWLLYIIYLLTVTHTCVKRDQPRVHISMISEIFRSVSDVHVPKTSDNILCRLFQTYLVVIITQGTLYKK